jgi:hypothetical protein
MPPEHHRERRLQTYAGMSYIYISSHKNRILTYFEDFRQIPATKFT